MFNMAENPEFSPRVLELLGEMEMALGDGDLGVYIRNLQVHVATTLKDDSLIDQNCPLALKIKEKEQRGETPSDDEIISFAEMVVKVLEKKGLL